jgi:Leucine-rich repeat (LRR) protein
MTRFGSRAVVFFALLLCLWMARPSAAAAATYYYFSGNPSLPASWTVNPDGTGGSPGGFAAPDFFRISAGRTAVFTTAITMGGTLIVESGCTMAVQTGGAAFDITGSLQVQGFAGLIIQDNPTGINWTGTVQYLLNAVLEYRGTVTRVTTVGVGSEFYTGNMDAIVRLNNSGGVSITNPAATQFFNGAVAVLQGNSNYSFGAPGTVTFNAPLTVAAGATLSGGSGPGNITPVFNNTVTSAGVLDMSFAATVTTAAAQNFNVTAGKTTLGNSATASALNAAINVSGGTLSLASSQNVNFGSSVNVNNGTLELNPLIAGVNYTIANPFSLTGSAALDMTASNQTVNLTLGGPIQFASTALIRSSTLVAQRIINIIGTGTITGLMTFDPALNNISSLQYTRSGTTLALGSTVNIDEQAGVSGLVVGASSTLVSAGYVVSLTTVSGVSNNQVYGTVVLAGSGTSAGQLNLSFNAVAPVMTVFAGGSIVANNGGVVTVGDAASNATLNNNGSVIINAGGNFVVRGNSSIPGPNYVQYTATTSTLTYRAGAASRTPTQFELPASMQGSVYIVDNPVTLPASYNLSVNGAISLATSLTDPAPGGSLTMNGPLFFNTASAVLNLQPASSIFIGGTGAITGTVSILPAATNINTLSMNRPNGRFLFSTPTPPLPVQNLFLLNGVVEGNIAVSVSLGGGSAQSYVDGQLQRYAPVGTSTLSFPVGDGARYLPINIVSAANTSASPLPVTVEAFNQNPNGMPGTGVTSLSRTEYWLITGTGLNSMQVETDLPSITATTFWTQSFALSMPFIRPNTGDVVTGTRLTSGTLTSTFTSGFFVLGNALPPPVITGFSPALVGPGTSVVITGLNLGNVTQVLFGTQPAVRFQNPTAPNGQPYIIAVVPEGGTNGTITVNAGGGVAVSTVQYQYAPPPSIIDFSPLQAGGATPVIVRGNAFFGTTATIILGGISVPANNVTINSLNQITFLPGPNATTSTITVRTIGGYATSATVFVALPTPVITDIAPRVGGNGTIITITGRNFPPNNTTTAQILVGGVPTLQSSIINSTTAYAVVSTGATGPVTIRSSAGIVTSATIFAFVGQPTIAGFTPLAGGAGMPLRITGRNLLATSRVRFGGVDALDFTALSDTVLLATVPLLDMNSTTSVTVRVDNPIGNFTSQQQFNFFPPPTITRFEPARGTSGTVVTITGTNFLNVTNVIISNVAARSFTVQSPTQIQAVVGAITTSGTVTVVATGGTVTSATQFVNVVLPPRISSIEPLTATVGTVLTIRGENLGEVNIITIGGVSMQAFRATGTNALTLALPPETQSGQVVVRSAGGADSSAQELTFFGPPFVTSVVPPIASPGSLVTINGLNLDVANDVRFGNVPVQNITVLSPTQIIVTVGNGATGLVRVQSPRGVGFSAAEAQILPPVQVDSLALVSVYNTTGGRTWRNATNWLRGELRTWFGVTIENGRVTGVELPSNGLVGDIPGGVFALSQLRKLNLSGNSLTGVISPTISGLRGLQELRLGDNRLTGSLPDSLARLSALTVLDVRNNQLSGALPQALCALASLRELNVSRNNLLGQINPCFAQATSLVLLDVSFNRFTGSIPRAIGDLPMLEEFSASNNQLSGGLPSFGQAFLAAAKAPTNGTTAGALNLKRLDLSNNQLADSIPTAFGALTQMQTLNLSNNRLVGTLPARAVAGWSNLETLDVSRNRLTGQIPSTIGQARRLKNINLSSNSLSGTLPASIGQIDSLGILTLDTNALSGAVPAEMEKMSVLRMFTIAANRIDSLPRLDRIRRLATLNAASNRLTFRDIEQNVLIDGFVYSPQDSVGEARRTTGVISLPFRLSFSSPGISNRYQWFKRVTMGRNTIDQAVTSVSPDSAFSLASFAVTDTGTYVCRVTNTQATRLTLFSRPVQVNFALPPPPAAAPELLFPPNASANVSLAPLLQWTEVPNTSFYEAQVSLSDDFTILTTSATATIPQARIVGLNNGVRYYWRVRARNAGGVGPWQTGTALFSFRTVDIGVEVAISSINFGRVAIGDSKRIRAAVANVGSQLVAFQGVSLVGDDGNVFASSADIAPGTPIAPGRDIPVDFIFTPKTTTTNTAGVEIRYTTASGGAIQVSQFRNLLSGRGGALKVTAANFDTVRVGRASLTNALIINNSNPQKTAFIRSVRLTDSAGGVFKPEDFTLTEVQPGDTATILLRAEPNAVASLRGRFSVTADIDTSDDGSINAIARAPRTDDLSLAVGIRALQDSAAPGEPVTLELFAAKDPVTRQNTDLRRVLSASQIPSNFRVFFRFNKQTLTLRDTSTSFPVVALRSRAAGSTPQTVVIPLRWFTPAAGSDSSVLAQVFCTAINGETDITTLNVEKFIWGSSGADSVPANVRRVFIEVPRLTQPTAQGEALTDTLRVALCRAGGSRFVRQTTKTALARSVPNPTSDGAEITYALRETGFVSLDLFDVSGKLIKTLVHSIHTSGEYTLFLPTNDLPSGAYILTLTTPTQIMSERLNVVK